jgi:cell fate regulator YaaT (PSP1 superfamily)
MLLQCSLQYLNLFFDLCRELFKEGKKMSCMGCAFNNSPGEIRLDVFDRFHDHTQRSEQSDIVEVRFKSTRKEFYRNTEGIPLRRGDLVVVSASPGHDVGEVSLTGYSAFRLYKQKVRNPERYPLNEIYRKANERDIDLLQESRSREKSLLIRSRQIAAELKLNMKIGEVEFRGDGRKAIFYYIADHRVDFRELIKRYAREFQIKIEMKQIGARQEAGLVGGIGSCGRELCCSGWRSGFSSISSDAAQKQGLSPAAQKMAGACGKLKCCLLYELDVYLEARQEFPEELIWLETAKGLAKPVKTDYLKKEIWYSIENNSVAGTFPLALNEVKEIIRQNKQGIKPESLKKIERNTEETGWHAMNDERIDRFETIAQGKRKKRTKKTGRSRNTNR